MDATALAGAAGPIMGIGSDLGGLGGGFGGLPFAAPPPASAKRRAVILGVGIVVVLLGVGVILLSPEIVQALGPDFTSSLTPPTAGFFLTGSSGLYIQAAVMGVGLTLIGIGGRTVRRVYHGSVDSYLSGGGPQKTNPQATSPEARDAMVQQMMARMAMPAAAPAPPPKPEVRVKCRGCGALNAEDAAFCSKCGQAL